MMDIPWLIPNLLGGPAGLQPLRIVPKPQCDNGMCYMEYNINMLQEIILGRLSKMFFKRSSGVILRAESQ